ncbi:hypothetical protein [Longimicrobium sp.]|uniref:hypothetical protein n=1 Tax=Longimicrobium sp. TaxID=2029185 RepID=UPI002D7F156A|nr:hypothetical protein [Longimicrobium sp.]
MRFASIRAAFVLVAFAAAACTQDRTLTGTTPPDTGGPKTPRVLGVYEITITGIGTDQMTSTATPMRLPGETGAISASLNPVASGVGLESVNTGSFSDGSRTGGGQRYLVSTFRVRNGTAAPLNNLTLIMASTTGTIAGTPVSVLRKFDNTNADPTIAPFIAPSGAVALGTDFVTMLAPYPDVLQAFTEAEVAAIAPPAGVTSIFPYGFVVRNKNTNANRTLPSAAADPNQWDGLLTVAFRVPLQSVAANDVFTLSFQAVIVEDTETRMTESIEEGQDTAAVRRLRDRATSLGATTVTVLNGSPVMDAAVPDYPGQRQICGLRIAGTAASPTRTIVTPGAYAGLMILRPSETVDACAAYFRGGTPGRPATNVPFTVTVKAMDRYGNVKTAQADTVHLTELGPPATLGAAAALVSGSANQVVTYTGYGSSTLSAVGRRLTGTQLIDVAGVTRTWTAGAGTTDWFTNNNWSPAAVPMSLDSVVIPVAAPLDPSLAANVQIGGVTVEDGALIALNAFDMNASANVTAGLTGGITNTSGRLFLSGVARTVQGKVPTLRVTGTYSLTGNVNARAAIQVDAGRLTVSGFRLQADSN